MNATAINKAVVTIALLVISLVTLGSANNVSAQGRRGDRDHWESRWDFRGDFRRDRRDDRDDERRDERRGYRDGFDEGRDDARDGRRFNFEDDRRYRNGDRDYREGFRRGYIHAFREFRDRRW